MIVKGPGIKPGSRASGNVYLGDLLATFCDLTGVSAPESNEGTSFKPVLMGEKPSIRDTLYGVYSGGAQPGMRCVRNGDWKLIEYESKATGLRETQLFQLGENPHEFISEHHQQDISALTGIQPEPHQTNLAKDPKHAAKLEEMRALLLSEMRRLGDPWRFSDQPDDGLAKPDDTKRGKRKRKE